VIYLIPQILNLLLKIENGIHEKIVSIIKDDDHLFVANLIEAFPVIGISKFSDFIKFMAKHLLVFDIVQINKEIDLIDISFDKIGRCLNRKGCFTHSRKPI
jgi:hypothetical protein